MVDGWQLMIDELGGGGGGDFGGRGNRWMAGFDDDLCRNFAMTAAPRVYVLCTYGSITPANNKPYGIL
jgi:hypothetical protein